MATSASRSAALSATAAVTVTPTRPARLSSSCRYAAAMPGSSPSRLLWTRTPISPRNRSDPPARSASARAAAFAFLATVGFARNVATAGLAVAPRAKPASSAPTSSTRTSDSLRAAASSASA